MLSSRAKPHSITSNSLNANAKSQSNLVVFTKGKKKERFNEELEEYQSNANYCSAARLQRLASAQVKAMTGGNLSIRSGKSGISRSFVTAGGLSNSVALNDATSHATH